jgi:hypothetical protein
MHVQKTIKDFLGCEIYKSLGGFVLSQTWIINKLIKDNQLTALKEKCKTLSDSSFFDVRHMKQKEMIGVDKQKWYCTTIRSLVKLLRPHRAKSVREPSKVMDGAAPAHDKDLRGVKQFIAYEKTKGLNIEP